MFKIELNEQDKMLVPWLASIGLVVMYWSPVERHIDQCVHIIYKNFGGNKLGNNKPRQLAAKLKFLKKCHYEFDSLKRNADYVEKLSEVTAKVAFIRDLFVHGCIDKFNENEIHIGKLKFSEDHINEIFTVDAEKLNTSVSNILEIAKKWESLAMALVVEHQKASK